jgi:hypothetical protein
MANTLSDAKRSNHASSRYPRHDRRQCDALSEAEQFRPKRAEVKNHRHTAHSEEIKRAARHNGEDREYHAAHASRHAHIIMRMVLRLAACNVRVLRHLDCHYAVLVCI